MANEIIWGIIFGLIGACTLNLGKALQKQGIQLFERQKMETNARAKKGAIWIIGSAFSLIQPLFQTIGQTILGSPATVYSSMLGIGIVIVIIYSYKVLKEPIGKAEFAGAATIIGGTLLFGIASISIGQAPVSRTMIWDNFAVSMIIIGATFVAGILYTMKTKNLWGVIWGIVGGSFGGMDNVFKSMSKDVGVSIDLGAFSGFASIFYYISFGCSAGAFLLTNVGYSSAKAITVVPAYTVFYILLPLLLEMFFYGIIPGAWQFIGIFVAIGGVVLSTAFKRKKVLETGTTTLDNSAKSIE
nr:hypothetical protein [Candidatus Sigynarchaeota archaeon]